MTDGAASAIRRPTDEEFLFRWGRIVADEFPRIHSPCVAFSSITTPSQDRTVLVESRLHQAIHMYARQRVPPRNAPKIPRFDHLVSRDVNEHGIAHVRERNE